MEIDPRHLAILRQIAESGSFTRAAATLRISQPALSNSIAQLERLLGVQVLERGRHGARLTEFGQALVRHARALEAHLTTAAEEIRLKKLGADGPLAVGVTPVTAAGIVPRAVGLLKRETPAVSVAILQGLEEDHMAMLAIGKLDLVVGPVGVYPAAAEIVEEALIPDPLSVIVRTRHPLAVRKSLSLQDLRDTDWALPSERSAFRRQLEALFLTAGVQWPTVCVTTNSMVALKSVVMYSDAVTIMPEQLVAFERGAGQLDCIRLRDAGHPRAIGLKWRRDRELSPLAMRFMAAVREVARPTSRRGARRARMTRA
jgi:LysR family transcriptional regulator, regulator for genes of the gallate degradation pathway